MLKDNLPKLNQEDADQIRGKQQIDGFKEYTYDSVVVFLDIRADNKRQYYLFHSQNQVIGWTDDHVAAFRLLHSLNYYTLAEVLKHTKEE